MTKKMSTSGFVYFVTDGEHIKVGFTAHPEKRMRGLRGAKPLTVLAMASGSRAQEKAVHAAFRAVKVQGEWFEASDELKALAAQVAEVGLAASGFQDEAPPTAQADEHVQKAISLSEIIIRFGAIDAADMAEAIAIATKRFALPERLLWTMKYRPPTQIGIGDLYKIIDAANAAVEWSLVQANEASDFIASVWQPFQDGFDRTAAIDTAFAHAERDLAEARSKVPPHLLPELDAKIASLRAAERAERDLIDGAQP